MAVVGRGADQYTVRFPEGLRDRIKAAAEANNRSINAEIVATLEEKYPAPEEIDFDIELAMDLIRQMRKIAEQIKSAISTKEIEELSRKYDEASVKLESVMDGTK